MADGMPVISQAKSLVLALTGNLQKARATQINFTKRCPGISQIRSLGELISGDSEAAKETQIEFAKNLGYVAVPIAGVAASLLVSGVPAAVFGCTAAVSAVSNTIIKEFADSAQEKVHERYVHNIPRSIDDTTDIGHSAETAKTTTVLQVTL